MMNTNGTVPRIYYLPNSEFAFKVGFEDKDNFLHKVFVTSTRNNKKKSMEAVYDEKSGLYVASGYFDEENTSYVPGTICVEYTEKQKDVVVLKDFDMQEYKSFLGEELQNSNVTYSK